MRGMVSEEMEVEIWEGKWVKKESNWWKSRIRDKRESEWWVGGWLVWGRITLLLLLLRGRMSHEWEDELWAGGWVTRRNDSDEREIKRWKEKGVMRGRVSDGSAREEREGGEWWERGWVMSGKVSDESEGEKWEGVMRERLSDERGWVTIGRVSDERECRWWNGKCDYGNVSGEENVSDERDCE